MANRERVRAQYDWCCRWIVPDGDPDESKDTNIAIITEQAKWAILLCHKNLVLNTDPGASKVWTPNGDRSRTSQAKGLNGARYCAVKSSSSKLAQSEPKMSPK